MRRAGIALGLAFGLVFTACGSDDDGAGGAGSGNTSAQGGSSGKGAAGKGGTGGRSAGSGGSGGSEGAGEGGGAGLTSAGAGGEGGSDDGGSGGQAGDTSGGAGEGWAGGGAGEGAAGGRAGEGAGGTGEAGNAVGGESGESGSGGEAGAGVPLPPVIVFDGGTRNGGIEYSGRAGLDSVCEAAKGALSIAGDPPRALISVNSVDAIVNFPELYGMPTNRPFASPGGSVIADDFADLLDGTIERSLEEAGVVTTEPGFWFTGSNADGTASENTCSGWTYSSFDDVIRANYGYTDSTNSKGLPWLGGDSTATCSAGQYHVLCVTW